MCHDFWFHSVGIETRKLITGAFGFTGEITPVMLQYCGCRLVMDVFAGDAAASTAVLTLAPLVGAPIADAGIVCPAIALHTICGTSALLTRICACTTFDVFASASVITLSPGCS